MKKLKAIAVIQARMSSKRLPGKVMFGLSGKPMIWHIVERLKVSKHLEKIIVATSNLQSDDELADFCISSGIEIFRGDLENVLSRYTQLMEIYPSKYIVRVTGDCPLISADFIDFQIEILHKYNSDLIWLKKNISILDGQAVYSFKLLEKVKNNCNSKEDLEHVGNPYISKNPDQFKIIALDPDDEISKLSYRFSVDELNDYLFIKKIYSELWHNNPIPLNEVLNFLKEKNEVKIINRNINDSEINKNVKKNFRKWNHSTFKTLQFNTSVI